MRILVHKKCVLHIKKEVKKNAVWTQYLYYIYHIYFMWNSKLEHQYILFNYK